MPLPEYRAREVIQNVGIVRAGNTGEGLRRFGLGVAELGEGVGAEEERQAVARAEIEGSNAVTRDEFNNLAMKPIDTSGKAGIARQKAQFGRYLNEIEIDIARHTSEIQTGMKDNPEGFKNSHEGYSEGVLQNIPEALRGKVGTVLNKYGSQGYTNLLVDKQRKDDALAFQGWDLLFKSKVNELSGLAAGGHFGADIYKSKAAEIEALLRDGEAGRLIDEKTAGVHRDLIANTSLAHAMSREALDAYNKAGGGFAGEKAAQEKLKALFDDKNIALSPEQKTHIESFARADIARNEGLLSRERADIRSSLEIQEIRMRLGAPPDMNVVLPLMERARVANDPDLVHKVNNLVQSQEFIAAFSKIPVSDQQAELPKLEERKNNLASGDLGPILYAEAVKAANAKQIAMSKDPMGTAARLHAGTVGTLAPLDMADPQKLTPQLQGRRRQAEILSAVEKTTVPPLTALELGQLSNAIKTGNPSQNSALLGALSAGLGPNQLTLVVDAVMEKGDDERFFAAAAMIAESDPQAGRDVIAGYSRWKEVKGAHPKLDSSMDGVATDYFGPSLYLNPKLQRAATDAGIAFYTLWNASPEGGKGKLGDTADSTQMQRALDRATGGMSKFNGQKIINPYPMKDGDFNRLMQGLTDEDLATSGPGYMADGKQVTAESIRRNGRLFTVAPGVYVVRFNGYDVRDSKSGGREWRLNLRGVPIRSLDEADPADAM